MRLRLNYDFGKVTTAIRNNNTEIATASLTHFLSCFIRLSVVTLSRNQSSTLKHFRIMKILNITSLKDFRTWAGASPIFYRMTDDEIKILEDVLDELYPNGITETELNDIIWFDADWVLDEIGANPDEFWNREIKPFHA